HWLTRLRHRFGRKFPIIGTLDLHANVSPAMTAACDALIAYRTNPHLDQRQRGIDAARLMARTLRGEVKPTMAAAFPPLAINIERRSEERRVGKSGRPAGARIYITRPKRGTGENGVPTT